MIMKTLILLLALLSLSACKTSYTYIVITPEKEVKKPELKQSCPVPDRWNCVDVRELERSLDSVYNRIKVK